MSTPYQHPDADQLNAFVENALPAHEREQTLAHLSTCAYCREIVALSLPPVEETLPEPKLVRKSWLSGWRLALPGAIAAPVLAVLLILALHSRRAPENIAIVHPQPIPQAVPEPASQPVKPIPPAAHKKSQAVAKTETPAAFLSERKVENLPIEGRSFIPLPAAAPSHGFVGGVDNNAMQANKVINGQLSLSNRALRQTARVRTLAALPSNLPIASTVANGSRVLALDTQNALFRSEDDGQHWTPVAAAWSGRAVRVDLAASISQRTAVAAALPPTTAIAAAPASPVKAFSYAAGTAVGPASLSGTVTDPSGATILGATVTVASHTVRTDASGRYAFSGLPAGSYALEATAPGFKQLTEQVTITTPRPAIADLTLSVGSVSQTVEVTSASNAIDLISTPSIGPAEPALFELTTEGGEHWTSLDGQTWTRR